MLQVLSVKIDRREKNRMDAHAEDVEVSVGGRVCLFGEHSDWAGAFRSANSGIEKGQVIVVGTEQQLYARVRRQEGTLTVISTRNDGTKV